MIRGLVTSAWFLPDPEDGGGDITAPRVGCLAILVGVGRSLGWRTDPGTTLGRGGDNRPGREKKGDAENAKHGEVKEEDSRRVNGSSRGVRGKAGSTPR